MKPIKVEKYREKLYRTCIKGGTWGDIWGKWDVILHQFGEEVKEECMKHCQDLLGHHNLVNKECNPACHQLDINSIRQNVIIK